MDVKEEGSQTISDHDSLLRKDFCYNHEIFVKGYRAVKAAKHNRFDEDLVVRSKRGDIDAAQQMLIRAGIVDAMKEK